MIYRDEEIILDRQTLIDLVENEEYYRCSSYADILKRHDYPSGLCTFSFKTVVVWDNGVELVKLEGDHSIKIKPCKDFKLPNQSPYKNAHIDIKKEYLFF